MCAIQVYLKEAGMEVELFEGIEPDPSVETVMKGADGLSAEEGFVAEDVFRCIISL